MKRATLALALAASFGAGAVSLNPDGLGQALIYPYYTVRSSEGNAFNTYLSVANHTGEAKAVRVRVREGRAGREVASLNLYLSPNDVWTSAIVPTASGARMATTDRSCTDPAFTPASGLDSLDFTAAGYTGAAADGFGDTLERTREGYVEMIEMATLSGAAAVAVTHNSAGVPVNCAAIRAMSAPAVAAPTGGLSGTLTLINVASGLDFTVNAEALADLSARPFFRAAGDPYPDFAAAEIDPVSVVMANNQAYRSVWSRPVDAVSAVMMRAAWLTEYVIDAGTASQTDAVFALPTRHHYVAGGTPAAPFSQPGTWLANCRTATSQPLGEQLGVTFFNREERGAAATGPGGVPPPDAPTQRLCAAVAIATVERNPDDGADRTVSAVLGSTTLGAFMGGRLPVNATFQNGWLHIQPTSSGSLTSLASSTRQDLATGTVSAGSHAFFGLPVVGFASRTFRNGTLQCSGGACQGNYGGAFPFKYSRRITP